VHRVGYYSYTYSQSYIFFYPQNGASTYIQLPYVSVKIPEREANPLSSVEIKIVWSYFAMCIYSLVPNLEEVLGDIIISNRLHDCFLISICTPLSANYKQQR
jgi:hypothetical protein